MRKTSSPKIVVGPNDSMPDVLTRLRTASGGPAALAIPASSSLLLTASEFRALKAAAEQARITLTVETDDRLRRQLATMFHLPVIDLLPGALSGLEDPPATKPEAAQALPPKLESVIPDLPKLDLPPPLEVAPKWESRTAYDPEKEAQSDPELPDKPGRNPRVPWKRLSIALAALLAIAVAGGGAAFLLQTATVTLTVRRQQVTAGLTYAVVSPDAETPPGAEFAIAAEPVTLKVPYEKTLAVTGALREPDQIASGTIALRNPTDVPIEIAAGTTFADREGVEYVFTAAVTVPANDPSSGAGRAEAAIQARIGGESANRETGLLSGKLDNGIFYSNRNAPIAGGTDKKTPQVSQEDIDQLIAAANAEIPELAITTTLEGGRVVLPGSLQAGELLYTIDRNAGDQVDNISIQAEMIVTGMAFLPADAVAQANDKLLDDLQANTGEGFELEPESVSISAPVLVNDQGDAGLYRLNATANVRPVINEVQLRAAAEEIAGMSFTEAEEYLESLPFVEGSTIKSSPGFLPKRIPDNAGKIEIETQ